MNEAEEAYKGAQAEIARVRRAGKTELVLGWDRRTNKTAFPALKTLPPEISELTNLRALFLDYTQVSDISSLSSLTKLTRLHLYNTQVSDISNLSNLTELTWLDLHNTQVSDISSLSSLTELTTLYLGNTQVSDISSLSRLTELTALNLSETQVSDILSLSSLTKLTKLFLSDTQVSDISSLSSLTELTHLSLDKTQVSDISSLSSLTNLTTLYLSGTQVSDISSLSRLTELTALYLSGTQISDISSLSSLTKLTTLNLGSTRVSDLSPLRGKTSLASGGFGLYIQNTPALEAYPPPLAELAEIIAEIKDDKKRTQKILDFLEEHPLPTSDPRNEKPPEAAEAGANRILANPEEAEVTLRHAANQIDKSLDTLLNLTGENCLPEPLETIQAIARSFRAISINPGDRPALLARIAELEAQVATLEKLAKDAEDGTFFFGLVNCEEFQKSNAKNLSALLFKWLPLGITAGTTYVLGQGPEAVNQLIELFNKSAPPTPPTLPPTTGV